MYADSIRYTEENHFCTTDLYNRQIQTRTRRRDGNSMRAADYRSERRIQQNRLRRQQEMKNNFRLFIVTVFLIAACSFTLSTFRSNAKNDAEASYKYYKSIMVSDHDTLWSIAQQYMDEAHYASVNDYINEVKYMNSLPDDSIHYGEYLVIPYYGSDPDIIVRGDVRAASPAGLRNGVDHLPGPHNVFWSY